MIESEKGLEEISGEDDFATPEEYRSYLISTLTSLQQQSPVFEQEDVVPPEQPPVREIPVGENLLQTTQFVKREAEIRNELMQDALEFQFQKFWLFDDSPAPTLGELGLQNHPDTERPNYQLRQLNPKKFVQNSGCENFHTPNVDEFFNIQECRRAICGPDQGFLFPDTSNTETYDDITTMKYLIKYKMSVGPLPISVNEAEPTQAQVDRLHAYIQAHLIPLGRRVSRSRLRSKIFKLQNQYRDLVAEGSGEEPNAQGYPAQVRKLMVDHLKLTWEQDLSANLGGRHRSWHYTRG